MARPSTMGPEAPSAWTKRATTSASMVGRDGAGEARENEEAEAEQQHGLAARRCPRPGHRRTARPRSRRGRPTASAACRRPPRRDRCAIAGQRGQIHVRRQRTERGQQREDRRHGEGVGSEHGRMARPKRLGCHPRAPLRVRSTVIPAAAERSPGPITAIVSEQIAPCARPPGTFVSMGFGPAP